MTVQYENNSHFDKSCCVVHFKMRCLVFLATVLLMVYLSASTPINPKRLLVNRPTETYVFRSRRSGADTKSPTKGHHGHQSPSKLELSLRKGEYICGEKRDRVCRLEPGEIPKGCVHCQYRIQ